MSRIRRQPFIKVLKTPSSGVLTWSCPTGWIIEDFSIRGLDTSAVSRPGFTLGTKGAKRGTQKPITADDNSPGSAPLSWDGGSSAFATVPLIKFYQIGTKLLDRVIVYDAAAFPMGGDTLCFWGVMIREEQCTTSS